MSSLPPSLQKRRSPQHSEITMPRSTSPPLPPDVTLATPNPPKSWGARHTLTFLGFLGFASSYSMRVNLSIAIVAMVNNTHPHGHSHNSSPLACPNLVREPTLTETRFEAPSPHEKFNWSGHEQGIILGSFFYGYVLTQVPGGLLATKYGGKWIFGLGMLVTAIFSLVTPLAASSGLEYLIAVRMIQGFGEGVTNPSMHAILAEWIPPLERSALGAFVYAGAQIGTVIALPVSGYLLANTESTNPLTSGWPSVFYVFGLLGIAWFCAWTYFIHSSPSSHPRISHEELTYIRTSMGSDRHKSSLLKRPTPWRSLLTSGPVIAILVAQTGHGWGLYTMLTELPTYMDDVLHFDIKQNAYLSALPYFLMWVMSVASSIYADRMRARGVSTTTVRKLFNTIAHWTPSILLIIASYTACDRAITVTLLTLAISINGAAWASFQVNHIDLSPNNAAVMMGITNGFANLCGIGAPYVAGYIINEGSSIARWRVIFYIAAIVYFVDNVVYLILASGETQPWDTPSEVDTTTTRVLRRSPRLVVNDASNSSRSRDSYEDDDREPLLVP